MSKGLFKSLSMSLQYWTVMRDDIIMRRILSSTVLDDECHHMKDPSTGQWWLMMLYKKPY